MTRHKRHEAFCFELCFDPLDAGVFASLNMMSSEIMFTGAFCSVLSSESDIFDADVTAKGGEGSGHHSTYPMAVFRNFREAKKLNATMTPIYAASNETKCGSFYRPTNE